MIVFVFLPLLWMSGHLYVGLGPISSPRNHTHSGQKKIAINHTIIIVIEFLLSNHHVENAKHRQLLNFWIPSTLASSSRVLHRFRRIDARKNDFSRKPHRMHGLGLRLREDFE